MNTECLIVLGFNDAPTFVGNFVSSSRQKGGKEIGKEMKEKDREERGTGMEMKKEKK